MKIFFLLTSLLLVRTTWAAPWNFHDASVLFPLPEVENHTTHLRAASRGQPGILLPKTYYKTLAPLTDHEDPETIYQSLTVLGLRIDPILSEVRLVFQPLDRGVLPGDEFLRAKDMGIHVSYKLPPEKFKQFINRYQAFKPNAVADVIHVHPTLLKEKMQGPFAIKLNNLLLESLGEKFISRITFMRLESIGGIWQFGGVEIRDQNVLPISIPRVRTSLQTFINVGADRFISSHIQPAPKGVDTFTKILEEKIRDASQAPEIIQEMKAAFRVEDPSIHTMDSVDCVSCHTAELARHWAFKNFPEVLADQTWPQTQKLTDLTLNNLRMFGYHGRRPTISQRVINETKEVLKTLRQEKL